MARLFLHTNTHTRSPTRPANCHPRACAGQPEIYLAGQLRNYRSGKRAHEVMAVIARPLTDQDIENLAQWYASLQIRVEAQ